MIVSTCSRTSSSDNTTPFSAHSINKSKNATLFFSPVHKTPSLEYRARARASFRIIFVLFIPIPSSSTSKSSFKPADWPNELPYGTSSTSGVDFVSSTSSVVPAMSGISFSMLFFFKNSSFFLLNTYRREEFISDILLGSTKYSCTYVIRQTVNQIEEADLFLRVFGEIENEIRLEPQVGVSHV